MAIQIERSTLEKACKNIIETILYCLPNAFKGTVYRIGSPPHMTAERITSGIINNKRNAISWGLPQRSEYNPPGKVWEDYRDEPARPLEAMAWCVGRQRSWTAESPSNDARSVRLQVEGVWEDYHHMEPVLIPKEDLYTNGEPLSEYPRNVTGEILWQGSPYAVVAVIKIHFNPNTIRLKSPETKVIKQLSRSLGTELLSYQLREQSVGALQQLAEDKLNSYNILADSLRNAVTKSGLVFSLIKLELSFLRKQWEEIILDHSDLKHLKQDAVSKLNEILAGQNDEATGLKGDLMEAQIKFLDLYLPPEVGANWLRMQIEERWEKLLGLGGKKGTWPKDVRRQIDALQRSLHLGMEPRLLAQYRDIPDSEKAEWVNLIYTDLDRVDLGFLDKLLAFLENGSVRLPYQDKSQKSLIRLKAVAETMGELEQDTNRVLREVLNGHGNGPESDV